ncbi:MAG: hypothetical protein ACRDRL_07285 [Sciscionella sp.]
MASSVFARRLGIVALCALTLFGTCLLAAWQWSRFESASGTLQNFGYVLQWPLFGLFPAFMFWRIRHFAKRDAAAGAEEADAVRGGLAGTDDACEESSERAAATGDSASAITGSSGRPSGTGAGLSSSVRLIGAQGRNPVAAARTRSRMAYVAPGSSAAVKDRIDAADDEVLLDYNHYLAGLDAGEDEHDH